MLHQIGVGALGPVFRTYEPERDRLVAVKAYRLDITPEQAQALAAELSRVAEAGLFHPSIVEPIGAGVEGTLAYSADEYVAAESLDVALRHYAPASLDTALPFISHLAGAIDFARAAGVGHGALHPRDIFVTPEEARATGFGVVEALERIGVRAPVRRPYTAPERIAGGPWSTPADVFSLAVIAYELLTGRRPAGLGSEIGPLTAGTPTAPLRAIHAVLARAMDEDPSRRHATALQLASALEAAASGELDVPEGLAVAAVAPGASAVPPADFPENVREMDSVSRGGDRDASARAVEAEPAASFDERLHIAPEADFAPAGIEPEDIAAEREDDEAHQRLLLEEWHAAEGPAEAGRFRDIEGAGDMAVDSDADRLLFDAAGMALDEPAVDEQARGAPAAGTDGASGGADEHALIAATASSDGEAPEASWRDDLSAVPPADRFFDRDLFRDEAPALEEPPSRPAHGPSETDLAPAWAEPEDTRPPSKAPFVAPQTHYEDVSGPGEAPAAVPLGHVVHESAPRSRGGLAALLLVVGLLAGVGIGYALWGGAAVPAGQVPAGPDAAPISAGDETGTPPDSGSAPANPEARDGGPAVAADSAPVPPPATPMGSASASGTDDAPAASAGRGTLIVRSTPNGAGVVVNGTWRGRTPLRLTDLPLARYDVRVAEPGYRAVSESLALSAGRPEVTVNARLQRDTAARGTPSGAGGRGSAAARGGQAPASASGGRGAPAAAASPPRSGGFTGSVYVDSRPRGATVAINGKPVGVTPLRVPDIPIGTHVVRLELPDHRIWSSTARVTAGREVRVTGSLEPIQ